MNSKQALVVYFSRTGATRKVASAISDWLRAKATVTVAEIQPTRQRTYLAWLFLSFFPTSRVKIRPVVSDLLQYDIVFLGFPKWTLSCPPINGYLKSVSGFEGKRVVLFMTYGGFDQRRYMRAMESVARRKKMQVTAAFEVPRKAVESGAYLEDVVDFLGRSAGLFRL